MNPRDISSLRHDLRTPLNQIMGYSDLIREEMQDAGIKDYEADFDKVTRASKNLLELIDRYVSTRHLAIIAPFSESDVSPAPTPDPHPISEPHGESGPSVQNGRGHLLVVDDNPANCDVLMRRLQSAGYSVRDAHAGAQALDMLRKEPFDLVLLDVLMPEMDGCEVLMTLKKDADLRHLPVIMVSALDELGQVVRCIEAGADDYLTKPVNPTLLHARLGSSLDRKRLRDQEQRIFRELQLTQQKLEKELAEAATYVRTQLPPPLTEGRITARWKFEPSSTLGGDAFDYFWLDDSHFAFHLLDVCGHGVGAALLSLSALHAIRSRALAHVDFYKPEEVMQGLNLSFAMEQHHDMYFTIWYGVFDTASRTLCYASAGHPPCIMFPPGGPCQSLRTHNLIVGYMPNTRFTSASTPVPEGSQLYLFSDGAYEIRRPNAPMMRLADLEKFLSQKGGTPDMLDELVATARREQGSNILDDDLSMIDFKFN
ncbi:MAG: SpoIIE family protein phosphatase [Verrucomicrobiae bacterium]|nr:SpoIIE family protein phosphatase [Verrucomicrobiae bacterium]